MKDRRKMLIYTTAGILLTAYASLLPHARADSGATTSKFAGVWILDTSHGKDNGIQEDDRSLNITLRDGVLFMKDGGGHTRSFKLDGSENVNQPFGKASANTSPGTYTETTKARLNGDTLTVEGDSSNGDRASAIAEIFTLSDKGKRLARKKTFAESTVEMRYLQSK